MFDENDLISRYTRAQAIVDGTLIDVTATAREAGFRYAVALTRSVWCRYAEVPEGVEAQDEAGRLWDILWMLRQVITGKPAGEKLHFQVLVLNSNRSPEPVTLKASCGPDDNGSPCITVMLPGED